MTVSADTRPRSHGVAGADHRTYLVDASIYVFRAWFSITPEFHDREGWPVHAVYGFTGFLCTLLEQTGASHLAVCFDESLDRSFRNDIYPDYKANREPAPVELRRQFSHCRSIAESMGVACFSHERYEADDLIGTLAEVQRQHRPVTIVSSDKDLAQLLQPNDEWWDFARQRRLAHADIEEHFGVRSEQMADFLALTGDPVDNIPGVPGIGAKSAAALLRHFGSLEQLLARVEEVQYLSGLRGARRIGRQLRDHRERVVLCRQLTGIATDAPIPAPIPTLDRRPVDVAALDELFSYLQLGRLLRQRCQAASAPPRPAAAATPSERRPRRGGLAP